MKQPQITLEELSEEEKRYIFSLPPKARQERLKKLAADKQKKKEKEKLPWF